MTGAARSVPIRSPRSATAGPASGRGFHTTSAERFGSVLPIVPTQKPDATARQELRDLILAALRQRRLDLIERHKTATKEHRRNDSVISLAELRAVTTAILSMEAAKE